MYYVLMPKPDADGNIMGVTYKKDNPRRSWMGGNKFSDDKGSPVFKRAPSVPIPVTLKEGRETAPKADYLEAPLPLMSKKLLYSLEEAGVNNIDAYPVEVCDTTGKVVYEDYFAVNIVGKVSAADLEKSVYDKNQTDTVISKSFDSLSINEDEAMGLMLFRLAENIGVVLVDQQIKDKLDTENIETIELLEPENIAAL